MIYRLKLTGPFQKSLKKLVAKDSILKNKTAKVFLILAKNPIDPSLHSHKVTTRKYGQKWSSRVTGNIRIIWDYEGEALMVILLLDIGGHTGKRKVYKTSSN